MDDLLNRQDGVIALAQALRFLSRKAIRHRVATGRWQQQQSALVMHNGPISVAQRHWIAVLSAGSGAVLGGITAAQVGGLRGCDSTTAHVLIPDGRRSGRLPAGVAVHRTAVWDERDILSAALPPRTKAARSVVDAAQWASSDDDARALIAAGFQQRIVAARDVEEVLRRLPRARRRRLIAETVADAIGGSHSLAEIDFIALCRKHGLPEPARQVIRQDSAGRRRYLDALFEEWQVHVEIDGSQHLDPRHAWSDMRRQNDLWITGDRLLRFPAWTLRHHPADVVTQLRAALHAAGWRLTTPTTPGRCPGGDCGPHTPRDQSPRFSRLIRSLRGPRVAI